MANSFDGTIRKIQSKLREHEPEPIQRLAELVCLPTFYGDSVLRVIQLEGETILRLITFDTKLLAWNREDLPSSTLESAIVPADKANQFWHAMSELNPESIPNQLDGERDGMYLYAFYREYHDESEFEAWSPRGDSAAGRFVSVIFDLTRKTIQSELGGDLIRQSHRYLH